MSLTAVVGSMGSGKNTIMALYAYDCYLKGIPVYSNFFIDLPNCYPLKPEDLVSIDEELAVIIIDEAYTWLESRVSSKVLNRYMSYILYQSRKLGYEMFILAQDISTVDIRFRRMINYVILCQRIKNGFKYVFYRVDNFQSFTLTFSDEDVSSYWSLFDTKQRISLIDKYMIAEITEDPEVMNKLVDELIEEFQDEGHPRTKEKIRDFLFRRGITREVYSKRIYDRLS